MDTTKHGSIWLVLIAGLALFGLPACSLLAEDEVTDGEMCSADDECSTGVCTSANLCTHSMCTCPSGDCAEAGEVASACREGWVCLGYDSIFAPVKEFFGGTPDSSDGYCHPTCAAGCPEHYVCDGEFCSPDEFWTYPEPTLTWTGDATGEFSGSDESTTVMVEGGATITVTGSAQSPVDAAIVGFAWTTVSGAGDYMDFEGESIEIAVPVGGYRRVELLVSDSEPRTSLITVVFRAI